MADTDFLYRAYQAGLIAKPELQAWGREALQKIRSGGGKTLTSWTLGGSFNATVTMTPEDLLASITFAIQSIDEAEEAGAPVSTVYASFRSD